MKEEKISCRRWGKTNIVKKLAPLFIGTILIGVVAAAGAPIEDALVCIQEKKTPTSNAPVEDALVACEGLPHIMDRMLCPGVDHQPSQQVTGKIVHNPPDVGETEILKSEIVSIINPIDKASPKLYYNDEALIRDLLE